LEKDNQDAAPLVLDPVFSNVAAKIFATLLKVDPNQNLDLNSIIARISKGTPAQPLPPVQTSHRSVNDDTEEESEDHLSVGQEAGHDIELEGHSSTDSDLNRRIENTNLSNQSFDN